MIVTLPAPLLLYIQYLLPFSYHTDEKDLEEEFGRYGKICDVQLVRTPDGASKGFGFITFKHLEVALAS